jgi:hypothetical protein
MEKAVIGRVLGGGNEGGESDENPEESSETVTSLDGFVRMADQNGCPDRSLEVHQ